MSTCFRTFAFALLLPLLGCGSGPQPNDAHSGEVGPRLSFINEILKRNATLIHGELPSDYLMEVDLAGLGDAARLQILLEDTPFTSRFEPVEGTQSRLAEIWLPGAVDAAVADDSPSDIVTSEQPAEVDTLMSQISQAEEDEALALMNEMPLSNSSLSVMKYLLKRDASTEQEHDLKIAIMQRLDLADEHGAKSLILDSLNSNNSELVAMALDSIDVWHDPSVAHRLLPLASHPNKNIRERSQQMHSDLSELQSSVETPRSMRTRASSIEELLAPLNDDN